MADGVRSYLIKGTCWQVSRSSNPETRLVLTALLVVSAWAWVSQIAMVLVFLMKFQAFAVLSLALSIIARADLERVSLDSLLVRSVLSNERAVLGTTGCRSPQAL